MNPTYPPWLGLAAGATALVVVLPARWRPHGLLAVSLALVAALAPSLLGAMLLASAIASWTGAGVLREPARRRVWVRRAVVLQVTLLLLTRHLEAFADGLGWGFASLGHPGAVGRLAWAVPVGMSFVVLRGLGHTLACASGALPGGASPREVLTSLAFFPAVVAGPIERDADLLPQLRALPRASGVEVASGLSLVAWGLVQKVVVADRLAPEVDRLFLQAAPDSRLVLLGAVGFGVQLLADFGGYTALALGLARLMGVRLTENFDRPFVAASAPEFWRRWHITLGRWMADHVYVPIARGGQASLARLAVATVATFLLVGLWHDLSWSMVVFGLWHGAWALAATLFGRMFPPLPRALGAFLHTAVVLVPSAIVFRDPLLGRALQKLGTFRLDPDQAHTALWVAVPIAVGALLLGVGAAVRRRLAPRLDVHPLGVVVHGAWWALALVALVLLYGEGAGGFLYGAL